MKLFWTITFFCSTLFGQGRFLFGQDGTNEPIVVRLATESQRLPIYIAKFMGEESGFPPNYCEKLSNVLRFDFDHNGMTVVLNNSDASERLIHAESLDMGIKASEWKTLNAFYVVKVLIRNKKLTVRTYSANTDIVRSFESIPLTGDLSSDRRQIHQLADKVFNNLFNLEGIASTRFIYTIKTQKDKKWASEIWEADYDGQNARQLTFESGYAVTPIYAPPKPGFATGSIFFVSYKTGQPKICYQNLNEKSCHRLTYLRGNQLMPAISKQRDKFAFISDVTGNPDLFIQAFHPSEGAIGKPFQAFSTHRATQGTPTFSPDGSQIAFVSNKDGSPRIYVMDVPNPGTSLKDIKAALITKRNRESTAPAWSPDGSKIAYCAVINGIRQIWIYHCATREERQLTQGAGNKENPTWAPNSLHLMFNSSAANACEIYIVNLNQTDATKISSGPGEKRFPCWEPKASS